MQAVMLYGCQTRDIASQVCPAQLAASSPNRYPALGLLSMTAQLCLPGKMRYEGSGWACITPKQRLGS